MAAREVAYLGPPGTYSHLVAEKRFGRGVEMLPFPTISDVCAFVSRGPSRRGVIPIENSSGGAVHETVDILLTNRPRIQILEELSLEVRLALIGWPGRRIELLYSHFAPLEHCESWIKRHLPRVQRRIVPSTAAAAQRASGEPNAAALGSRRLAAIYGLKVLRYPIKADVPNMTSFLLVTGRRTAVRRAAKTTLAVKLPNTPGSLCSFLETFRDESVNLSRLISRPIPGCPRQYAFLVDIDGCPAEKNVARALAAARAVSVEMRLVGSYPCHRAYHS